MPEDNSYENHKLEHYIFITEGGEDVFKTTTYSEGDLESCEEGLLQIIRISDMSTYYDYKWTPLELRNP